MLRDLIVSAFIIGLLPVCFRRPFIGLLLFSLLAYMRLQDLTWGFAKYQRWSFYVAIVMFLGWIFSKHRSRFMLPETRCWIMVLLIVIVGVGLLRAGDVGKSDFQGFVEFCKIIGIALFTTGIVKNRAYLRILIWTVALSFGFFALKSGLQGLVTLGHMEIIRGPGGMLLDRNDFALALCMAVPMLLHLGTSEKKPILRNVALGLVPLAGLTVMFTHSRGAFLALSATVVALVWRSQNRLAGLVIVALLGTAGALLAPKSFVDRMATISEYEEDSSAVGRLEAWVVAGNMIQANPILGVGFDRFQRNYWTYDPKKRVFSAGGMHGRVAHNSYLQIWAECGTPAFLLYLLLIVLTFVDVWRVRAMAKARYHASWILSYATMFEASLVAFVVGSFFLNRAHFDLFYHFIAMSVVFGAIARKEMRDELAYPVRPGFGRRGTLVATQPHGFDRRPRVRGFDKPDSEPAFG